jgi:hypothetical protein
MQLKHYLVSVIHEISGHTSQPRRAGNKCVVLKTSTGVV